MTKRKRYTPSEATAFAKEVAHETLSIYAGELATAIEKTFREEYGFGDLRVKRLIYNLNQRLPENIRFSEIV